jgi:hypothetical protein
MDQLADRLEGAADTLTTVDKFVPELAVAASAFGADDAGVPGRVGRQMHARWLAVLDARSREAAVAGARLSELARSLRAAERMYADADDAVARRVGRRVEGDV